MTVYPGQPLARAHLRISRFPTHLAVLVVESFHGQPPARAHCVAAQLEFESKT